MGVVGVAQGDLWGEAVLVQGLQTGEAGVPLVQQGPPGRRWALCQPVATAVAERPVGVEGQRPLQPARKPPATTAFGPAPRATRLAELLDALVDEGGRRLLVRHGHAAAEQHLKLLGESRGGQLRGRQRGRGHGRRPGCRRRRCGDGGKGGAALGNGKAPGGGGRRSVGGGCDIISACGALARLAQCADDLRDLGRSETQRRSGIAVST